MKPPNQKNVWIIDIETSPLILVSWGLGKQYLTTEHILEDWHIMAFSAKRLNESGIIYEETRNGDDSRLLRKLWNIFNNADVVITQNGQKFDEPKIKARMMLKGLSPYRVFKHHDTYLQNTDKDFTSHSLAYLSDKFCKRFKKLKHKRFPGLSLWKECRAGNKAAWREMRDYNIRDVLATEELYLSTRGWSKKSAPEMYEGDDKRLCGYCGAYTLVKRGFDVTKTARYERKQCQACGKWCRGEKVK